MPVLRARGGARDTSGGRRSQGAIITHTFLLPLVARHASRGAVAGTSPFSTYVERIAT